MFWILYGETPGPQLPPSEVDDSLVTPGVLGFAITFGIVVVVVLLVVDMVRRMRRVRYRAEINDLLDAEESGQADGTGSTTPEDPSR